MGRIAGGLVALWLATACADAREGGSSEHATVDYGSRLTISYSIAEKDGAVIESNVGAEPVSFQMGDRRLHPTVQDALIGLGAGDEVQVELAPEQGFGPVKPEAFQEVDLEMVPKHLREPGKTILMLGRNGEQRRARVHEIRGHRAVVDMNHPLAGKTVVYEIEIVGIE